LFAKDTEDPAELSKLAEKKLEVATVAEAATGWPQWRGPLRDGRAPDGPFRTDWDKRPPTRLWSTPCGGSYSSLAVVGGKVYTQDRRDGNERVICLNAADGKQLWEHSYPADSAGKDAKYAIGPRATPTIQGNSVYVVGGAGKLICLEMPTSGTTPTVRWQHDLLTEFDAKMPQWGVACSPLVEGDLVIVQPGGKNGSVAAFDKNSGDVRWRAGNTPSGYSSPIVAAIGGNRSIFALTSEALLAIDMEGKVTDSFPWLTQFGGNVATPLNVDDYIFISSGYGQGCALLRAVRKDDGVKFVQVYVRHQRGLQNHHCTSVYKDRYLFGFDGDAGRLKCVEFNTGNEKKDWEATGVGKGSLILAGKYLIIQTERGELCLVEATPEEFRLEAKIPRVLNGNNNWASPTLVDGKLYLRDEEKIVCYDVRP
jgi:outer membrane protein assembly factor BamB